MSLGQHLPAGFAQLVMVMKELEVNLKRGLGASEKYHLYVISVKRAFVMIGRELTV
jgi:hypothetical protein